MAPIKFEEQIKDKLEQRTVTPSSEAWSKLSQQLEAEDKRSKKSSFWWFGIAASIAALVFVSITYFGQKDEASIDNIIVKDEVNDVISPKVEDNLLESKVALENEVVATGNKEEVANGVDINAKNILTQKQQKDILVKKNQKPVLENIVKTEKQIDTKFTNKELNKAPNDLSISVENIELNSVIAELQKVKTENKTRVTDQQIDSLLKVANRELLMDKSLKKKDANVVNADALLQDVEDAMGQSFRTRIYETLKGGFKEVKKAVVQRNN